MLISCTWLNDLLAGSPICVDIVDDAKTRLSAEAVAQTLTGLGLEVEGIHHFDLPGVIVGEIREVVDHPDSDRLHVVQLFDGSAVIQVVCGANNLPGVGGKVAFAPVGTTLPGGLTLGARELRGVASQGMICSEDEIDLGSDHDGIVILPREWPAGTLLVDLVPGLRDSVIEIGVTPNRPDALGHIGVAIDLAVALGISTRTPPTYDLAALASDAALVEIAAGDRCGRYLGYALEGVKVGRSPLWLRARLHRVGLRSINDVVDVTNLVLMETGQPIHAFDRAKLAEGRVVVRRAQAGEPLQTLDGREVALVEDDLAIADAERPQALAGVMGGADSAVDASTSTLLVEVAWFEPRGVRRSARRHGFHTDASHRFERGVDYGDKLELAAKRALQLLVELTGAQPIARAEALGERPTMPEIRLRPARIRELLGMDIAADEAARVLVGLRVHVDRGPQGASEWRCVAPSFRPDLRREVDLIEEVMRHHGLDDLPAEHSVSSRRIEPIPEDPRRAITETITDALRGAGLHEHLGLAFSSDEALAGFAGEVPPERRVRLANPLRQQYALLRSHMLPGLLDAVAINHARHDRAIGLFESGRVYRWPVDPPSTSGPTAIVDAQLPEEPRRVAVIRAGRGGPQADAPLVRALIQDLLATLEGLARWAHAKPCAAVEWLHPGVQIGLWLGAIQVGRVGEVHPDLARARGLDQLELAYGELWIDALVDEGHAAPLGYRELARFPASARDLSLDLATSVPASSVVEAFGETACKIAGEQAGADDPVVLGSSSDARSAIELREDWRGQGVGAGRRALLLRLHYRARERSVTDAEVQALHDALVDRACARLRAIDSDLRVR